MINIVNKKNHSVTDYDYYIARPNILGNPFSHKKSVYADYYVESRDIAIDNYREWLKYQLSENNVEIINELKKLQDFYNRHDDINLVCWCSPKRCHGEVIKDFLNGELFE